MGKCKKCNSSDTKPYPWVSVTRKHFWGKSWGSVRMQVDLKFYLVKKNFQYLIVWSLTVMGRPYIQWTHLKMKILICNISKSGTRRCRGKPSPTLPMNQIASDLPFGVQIIFSIWKSKEVRFRVSLWHHLAKGCSFTLLPGNENPKTCTWHTANVAGVRKMPMYFTIDKYTLYVLSAQVAEVRKM